VAKVGNRNGRFDEMKDDFELTPEEKMAFQRLPRASRPSDLLEERIVRSLREEGILRDGAPPKRVDVPGRVPGVGGEAVGTPLRAPGAWIRPWAAAAAVAASVILFASGILMGQWLGNRSTAQAFLAVREQDAAELAMTIQEAGSAYVSALAALSALGAGDPGRGEVGGGGGGEIPRFSGPDIQRGREVALGALYGAANELARMSPEDAEVLRVLRILEDRKAREEGYGDSPRNVVWF
jgi:hypothetical protein